MRTLDLLRNTALAAIAAAPLAAAMMQSANAQQVVAATCPTGYSLSGNQCMLTGPAPSCPSGYVFSAGECVATTTTSKPSRKTWTDGHYAFVTRDAFGVSSATEIDGAKFCAVTGSPSVAAAEDFFKENKLNATHVKVDNDRAGIEKYQKYDCDLLVVASRAASSTAKNLEPKGDHLVLPEKFGDVAPANAATKKRPAPVKTAKTNQSRPKQPRRIRCSKVRYGYTRGNTCGCAGGRVFNGRACVKRRW